MKLNLSAIVFVLLIAGAVVESARILALVPIPVKSHFNSFSTLLEELARRGHEVTVASAFPRTQPLKNYKDITIDDYMQDSDDWNMFERRMVPHPALMAPFLVSFFISNCDRFLSYPQIQELANSGQMFDLILAEIMFTECAYGLVHKYKAPFIQLSSNTIVPWLGDGVGNPFFPSYNPDLVFDFSDHMTFAQRIENTLYGIYMSIIRNVFVLPRMESIMRKHFKDEAIPSIKELEDLQEYLENAPEGVIFFSFGSHVRSTQMPEDIRNNFIKAFSQLRLNVLWKWEADSLPGQPKNVRIEKWLPQNDLLAHPNVKAFITHGGLLSIQEATYHGVPLVTVPIVGDQIINAEKARRAGYAVVLDLGNITAESVTWAVNEVIVNPSYRENAQRLSKILKDQPEKPLDRAVFWVEYVIRHNGAPHMKSAALKLNFFQYYCLDVIAVVLLSSLALLAITVLTCKAACRRICSRKSQPVSKSKKDI